jgi:hypothetical protein
MVATFIRTRPQTLLAKVESSEGVDPTPTAAANAIKVENVNWTETPNVIQSNEVSGALDVSPPLIGGVKTAVTFDVWVKARALGSTAPDMSPLLKACGMTETLTTTSIPAAPEALAAGGSTTTAVLGASATGTANLYTGMPITFSGTVSGDSFIAAYSAAKLATLTDIMSGALVATTNYVIPINALYRFASSSLTSATLWLYRDGKKLMGIGCRGTFTMQWVSGEGIKFSFSFMGVWVQATDTANVSGTFNDTTKLVWRGTTSAVSRMRWNRILAQCKTLTFDAGNTVVRPDNPEGVEGYDPAQITLRNASGSFDPLETLLATRDILADMRNNTARIVHARAGTAAGARVAVTAANCYATQNNQGGDRDGFSTEAVNFRCTGDNDAFSICFY